MGLRARQIELGGETYVVFTFPAPSWDLPVCLTLAEREVALAILAGATNEQIAERRASSVRTIAHQIASIFEKLTVSSRAELAFRLARFGNGRTARSGNADETSGGRHDG
jgi:DNA-binding CsgD family transcriptional regulator